MITEQEHKDGRAAIDRALESCAQMADLLAEICLWLTEFKKDGTKRPYAIWAIEDLYQSTAEGSRDVVDVLHVADAQDYLLRVAEEEYKQIHE